jgi:hypothetical protein
MHKVPADKGDSSWKVGDGGVWDPASLRPLFVLRLPDGEYDLGVVWSGTEGASLHLMRSAGPGMTDRSVGYRYWLPK